MESSLHRSLKSLYAGDAAATEVKIGRFRIDVVRQDELIEIQLGSLASLRDKVRELWDESYKVWFPGGVEDPDIELISVRPERGEYWDTTGGNRAKYLWEAAKAYVSGTTPEIDESQHGRVNL